MRRGGGIWRALLPALLLLAPACATLLPSGGNGESGPAPSEEGPQSGRGSERAPGAPALPDLILSNLSRSLDSPGDMSSVTFFATVFNDGAALTQQVTVELFIDGVPQGSSIIGGLFEGGSATVGIPWTALSGQHEALVVVDAQGLIPELNETNNWRVAYFSVPSPDIVVQNVSWYPIRFRDGDAVTINVELRNRGPGSAGRAFVLAASVDQTPLPRQLVGPIPAGASALATLRWTAFSGSRALFLEADAGNSLRETNETNNRAVVLLGADYPDLVVSSVSISPPEPEEGEIAFLNATVTNLGSGSTSDTFQVHFTVDGVSAGAVDIAGLASGSSRSVSIRWRAVAGHHEVRADADASGEILEAVESNNHALTSVRIGMAELSLGGLQWTPALPSDGMVTRVGLSVRNSANNGTRAPFVVALYIDGSCADATTINGLGPQEARNLSLNWTASGGAHELCVVADPHDTVHELNESNNALSLPIIVPMPDLTPTNLTLHPSSPSAGESVEVRVSIRNTGPGNLSRMFLTRLYWEGREVASEVLGGLEAGSSRILSMRWTAEAGEGELTAVVDPEQRIAEANELNNSISIRTGVPFPDITVSQMEWFPPGAGAGERLNVSVRVENKGPGDLTTPVSITLYANASATSTLELGGLGSGRNATISFSLVLPSASLSLSAVVDPLDRVAELSEANNRLTRLFPTGVEAPAPPAQDYFVREPVLLPETPVDGETASVIVTVCAAGTATGPPAPVEVALVADGRIAARGQAVVSAGEGMARLEWKASAGAHKLTIIVDPDGEIPETREDNNRASLALIVGPVNLVVSELAPIQSIVHDGETVCVLCRVENLEPNPTRAAFTLSFYVDGVLETMRELSGLPARASMSEVLSFRALAGDHRLRAVVDPEGSVSETVEEDNEATAEITVRPPDIEVTGITAIREADEGNTVGITATIRNAGAPTVRRVTVIFLVDGFPAGSAQTEGLLSGATHPLSTKWTALPGNHTVTVIADPGREIIELDEENNRLRLATINVSLPDLTVQNLTVSGPPVVGAECIASVDVLNLGETTLRDFYVSFSVDETVLKTERLGGLPGGASCSVSVRLPVLAGPRLYSVRVDSTQAVKELDETNNLAYLSQEATPPAELSLVGLRVQSYAVDGEEVGIFAEILNSGVGNTTEPFQVSFFVDGRILSSDVIGGLPAGETAVATARWTATPGRHRVRAVVDPTGVVPEGNEGDNEQQRDGPSVEHPDLTIERISTVRLGGETGRFAVFAQLENIGGPTLRTVSARLLIDGRPAETVSLRGLTARTATTLYFEAQAAAPGILSVSADPSGELPEADESNNAATAPFLPLPELEGSRPDLVVERWALLPPSPVEGQQAMILATITNLGNGSLLGRSEALLELQSRAPDPTNPRREVIVGTSNIQSSLLGLLPGGSAVISFPWTATGGNTSLTVTVNPSRRIPEWETGNNALKDIIEVPRPNLQITGVVKWSLTPGLKSPIFVLIENKGPGDTLSTSPGELYINGILSSQLPLRGLLSGHTTVCPARVEAEAGESTLLAVADAGNRIIEMEKSGNSLLEGLHLSYPDLTIANITWTRHLDNESIVTVFAEIRNEGTGAAGRAFEVSLSADARLVGRTMVPCLRANSSTLVSWRWPLVPGNHTLSVEVDTGDSILEARENNNRMDVSFPLWRSAYTPTLLNLRLTGLRFSQQNTGRWNASVNTVTLFMTFENDGLENLSASSADVILNGKLLRTVPVPPLANDSEAVVELAWVAPVADLNVSVRLDPRRRLAEDFETDNDLTLFIPANHPPIASAGGNRTITAGDKIELHPHADDPDVILEGGVRVPGYIALYEWDLNGDGVYEHNSTISGDVTAVFHTPGRYMIRFRVTDDQGATAVSEAVIVVRPVKEEQLIRTDTLTIAAVGILFFILVLSAVWLVRGKEEIFRK
ncbi:MAG: CARDB domain-containing protein [Thermoplasmata archaeon]